MQKRKPIVLSEAEKNVLKLLKGADIGCDFTKFFTNREFDRTVRTRLIYEWDRMFKSKREVVSINYDRHTFHYFTVTYSTRIGEQMHCDVEEYVLSKPEMEHIMLYVQKIITAKQFAEIKRGF